MAENSSSESEKELSPKQYTLIEALLAGHTIAVAAKVADVGERTVYTWMKETLFRQEYETAKQAVFDEKLEALRDNITLAIDTLKRNMTEAAPYVQVQAASKILDMAIELHKVSGLEARLIELEELVKATSR